MSGVLVDGLFEGIEANRSDVVATVIAEAKRNAVFAAIVLEPRVRGEHSETAIQYALRLNRTDAMRALIAAGARLAEQPGASDGQGLLQSVALEPQMVNVLLNALLQSIATNDKATITDLLEAGIHVNATDGAASQNTPLHWAAHFANAETLQLLLDRGADPNATNAEGATPLHDAVRRGSADMVRLLLAANAQLDQAGRSGSYASRRPIDMLTEGPEAGEIRALFVAAEQCRRPEEEIEHLSWLERFDRVMQQAADSLAEDEYRVAMDRLHNQGPSQPMNADSSASSAERPAQMKAQSNQAMDQKGDGLTPPSASSGAQEDGSSATLSDEGAQPSSAQEQPQETSLDPSMADEQDTSIQLSDGDATADVVMSDLPIDNRLRITVPTLIAARPPTQLLWPSPQRMTQLPGRRLLLGSKVDVYMAPSTAGSDVDPVFEYLARGLGKQGCTVSRCLSPGRGSQITLRIKPTLQTRPESYRIIVERSGAVLVGGDVAGLRHAVSTLIQLSKLTEAVSGSQMDTDDDDNRGIPSVRISDWPLLPNRAFMLDVSRDKVPTLNSLKEIVDLMCLFKMNQLQLYMEHTFAYADHEVVWRGADPYTHAGHLAECPNGIDFGNRPSGPPDVPFSLCPVDPRLANVGLDETVDIGKGRSRPICEAEGTGDVYLQYLRQIRQACRKHKRTMMFWSDMLFDFDPLLMFSLPSDVIAMEWGYEANHPFDKRCQMMADAAIPFYTCCGTSSWNSITGRTQECISNIKSAVQAALRHDGLGSMITDWGDHGHTQPWSVSYPGLTAFAGLSWNRFATRCVEGVDDADDWNEVDLAALLDFHVFGTNADGLGRILLDLGNTYQLASTEPRLNRNGAALFHFFIFAGDDTHVWTHMDAQELRQCHKHLKQQLALLDAILARDKLTAETHLVKHSASLAELPNTARTDLANRLLALVGPYKDLWLARNRRGGMQDSLSRIEHTINCLLQTAQ
ncbi:uncharacterized protein MONBRDRAFT_28983 [Monosiga brevicollis MX1]|uniref:Beta-hexosaminidase bacterial type N-terminal domain-containing protein n=1 Tax=Monosiga brevicollis TaxID=81824 RepID=A9V9R8_MONBE|nr:uncharacterized protein MONBRDRAFT_28983 [Monosiga brevicollis MX1]EDQ85770.1 predicted protein [Monosiga brevicollis MX1]|eukprot:XP_001749485.1 hypothetical protein [Monosiga brevicollis MX1]